jgi:hypothetical protein
LTADEELTLLEDVLRRLKVEYDIYFGGGSVDGRSKRPPADTEWRVQSLLKKYSDSQKLSFEQRFRYNAIAQRYAIMSDLWRQKLKIREEGYRRPQDALLAIQGLRTDEEHKAAAALDPKYKHRESEPAHPFAIECHDADADRDKVQNLFTAFIAAKREAGESLPAGNFDSFLSFVRKKTEQIRRDCKCPAVEYRVETLNSRVSLKAKAVTASS